MLLMAWEETAVDGEGAMSQAGDDSRVEREISRLDRGAYENGYLRTLLIIAPPGTVSHPLICAIEAEFPWLTVVSTSEPESAHADFEHEVQLIALSAQLFGEIDVARTGIARKHPAAGLALLTDFIGHAPRLDLSDDPGLRGFLPMNVRLDVWLAILRIMLLGGTYFTPSERVWGQDGLALAPSRPAQHTAVAMNEGRSATGLLASSGDISTGQSASESVGASDSAYSASKQGRFHEKVSELTTREREVLHMVSKGSQNKIIAAELGLSENTVKIHLHNIIRKLGVCNRTQAAARYMETTDRGNSGFGNDGSPHRGHY